MNPTNPNSNRTRPAAPNQARPEVPRIGPFQVLAELGRGGMGAVYRARDPRLGREVAVKVLPPEVAADRTAKERFLREARAQAAVEHDHIVPIHEVNEENGVVYLVMPLLKGQSLSAALKQNPRPPVAELVRIGREIAEGLAAAHAAGLVHRDIKPGNVWLEAPKRRVKILDFGIARGTGPVAGSRDDANPLTRRNELLGTPHYMSPEQARAKPVDARSDLFSLGVVLYQMATGARPFGGDTEFDVMAAVANEHQRAVAEVVPGFPPALSDLIDRLLAKDPAARPATAAAVAEQLEHLLATISVRAVAAGPLPDAASGAANPWADLDLTDGERETRRGEATRRVARDGGAAEGESETRTYSESGEGGGAPKWLIPAAVAGLLLAVALFAVVLGLSGPKRDGGAKVTPPPDANNGTKQQSTKGKEQTGVKVDHARALAEAAGPFSELVLNTGDGVVIVPAGGALPNAQFHVAIVSVAEGATPPPNARAILTEKLRAANYIEELSDRQARLGSWSEDEWDELCRANALQIVSRLEVRVPLTARTLARAKKLQSLSSVRFESADANPLLLAGLKELSGVNTLTLQSLGRAAPPTPEAWTAISQLPLNTLFLWDLPELDARGARVISAMPKLQKLGISCPPLTDAVAAELLARERPYAVALSDAPKLTDKVCTAILNRPRLDYVQLARVPNVTAAGVATIRSRHPEVLLDWDGTLPIGGLAFDGAKALVTIPTLSFDGQLPLTLEAWVTPETVTGGLRHICLLGRQGGGIGITQTGAFGAGLRRADGSWANKDGPANLRAGARAHLAAVFTKEGIALFVNGKQTAWHAVEMGNLMRTDPASVVGGPARDTGGSHFHGTIHAVRVSKAARYERNKEFAPRDSWLRDADTLALYTFDEGENEKLFDRSGNGHHGTILGGKWVK
jgi:serine/threonine protein kinase